MDGITQSCKVVVTGSVGAGKTTFIRTISEIRTVDTEAAISDGVTVPGKTTTTVGIDFGRVALNDGLELYLFGTPGQQRFDFMWDIVSQGMLGFIVLVDGSDPASWPAARQILEHFRASSDVPAIIAVNKMPDFASTRDAVVAALGLSDADFVVPTDALDAAAVKQTLIELLELVVASLVDEPALS